ncbi:MAG: STAS domain-containing protein [Clostridia bacterium]|nr:STAS domain-containing protein [Clostridia bacterium]
MSVEIKVSGQTVTAFIKGDIDHHTAGEMRRLIDNSIDLNTPSLLSLDFSGVSFMDSSGIGLVMGRYRNLSKYGGSLRITGAGEQIYKVMKLAGLEKLAILEK